MSKLVSACLLPLVFVIPTVLAQDSAAETKVLEDYFKVVKGDLTAKRDSALRTLVQLSEDEAKAFWPLVETYDDEMAQQRKQRRAVIEEFLGVYDKLTPEQAQKLADRALDLDVARNEVRRKYFKLMAREVSPVVAAQFLQLQGQFETMGDLKLAAAMPLATR